jgi:hypothetical protein
MANLMERKRQYKKSGEKLKEKAIKILMNSGYGCFGNTYFEYRDPRVAELITADIHDFFFSFSFSVFKYNLNASSAHTL